mmetsp:Transcript_13560/g.26662  ORF Transcript_13560/g.26662 Transcript_13560/m.26662 type:complete len:153 (-) Transcript_13560:9-467(-)
MKTYWLLGEGDSKKLLTRGAREEGGADRTCSVHSGITFSQRTSSDGSEGIWRATSLEQPASVSDHTSNGPERAMPETISEEAPKQEGDAAVEAAPASTANKGRRRSSLLQLLTGSNETVEIAGEVVVQLTEPSRGEVVVHGTKQLSQADKRQ